MWFRNLKVLLIGGLVLGLTGCTTDQLTAFSCTFDNDPTMPRSPECLAVDRQQDENARIRRLEREAEQRREENQRRFQAEADARFEALKARVGAMTDGHKYFLEGDWKRAIEAAGAKRLEFMHEVDWYRDRNLSPPREFALLCAEVTGPLTFYYLFDRHFDSAIRLASMIHTERNGAYCDDPSMTWVKTNLAHALMFQGKLERADKVYQQYRGVRLYEGEQGVWEEVIAEDFRVLREHGLDHPHMDVVLQSFRQSETIDIFRDLYNEPEP